MLSTLIALLAAFPPATVPDGWGVNIHFTDAPDAEVATLARPFRYVRMDFFWAGTERERGKYDFAAYDRLLANLDRHRVRPYFILAYGNDLYQEGSPRTPESRAAFGRWFAAALNHFKGRGIVWEVWNEPNISFWKPKPNVDEYIALAKEVGETMQRTAPGETLIGPATSGFDWTFLQRCLDAGLLRYWSAVSVHPYRQNEPESVVLDWLRLRTMLDRAAPGRNVPMISGEWGYSELYDGQTAERQGQYIARQYLANLSCDVPISIFYDWKDDGTDPKEPEHHFGTVKPDLTPKPAYRAADHLTHALAGFRYVTRLRTADPAQWVLLFRKAGDVKIAAWTTGSPGRISLAPKGRLRRDAPGATSTVSADAVPVDRTVAVVSGSALETYRGIRPLPWAKTTDEFGDDSVRSLDAGRQRTLLALRQPVTATIYPNRAGRLVIGIENPFRFPLTGSTRVDAGMPTRLVAGETELPIGARRVRLEVPGKGVMVRDVPRFTALDLAGATATADGDSKVRAVVSATPTAEGTTLRYDFDPGWRFAELHPVAGVVTGSPAGLGMWVKGDGSGNLLRMRYVDATGQTFQPQFGVVDWTGWRFVRISLDGTGGRWGGANDGTVHYPIRITTLALFDMAAAAGGKGEIEIARPVLIDPN